MKMLTSLLALGLMATPALAATQTFNDVSVVDVACSKKVAANADAHTRDCALMCEKSGYGIVTSDKKFLKFDADGNAKIAEALKASDKTDHLRVNVSGDVQGDTIKVSSVKLL
jgi:Tfp pilus assembly ATPase PilU